MNRSSVLKPIINILCIVLIILSVLAIIFGINVLVNKNSKTTYAELPSEDAKLFSVLSEYLTNEDGTKKDFSKPIAFVKDNGLFRGRAFLFNMNITEYDSTLGCNGGTYATEILLPDELELPTMYRLSALAPSLGSLFFPADHTSVNLCGVETIVVSYSEKTLNNGAFIAIMDNLG